jgi:hypothetical protein
MPPERNQARVAGGMRNAITETNGIPRRSIRSTRKANFPCASGVAKQINLKGKTLAR